MSKQVLVLQSDAKLMMQLANFFTEREDKVWQATDPAEAAQTLKQSPDIVVIDLHLLNEAGKALITQLRQNTPAPKLLVTVPYPDPQHETRAKKDFGVRVFLRSPFTRSSLEQALHELDKVEVVPIDPALQAKLPKVRIPVRVKITLPYVILALVLALAAAYLVSRVVLDTLEERFTNQLIEAGKLANDWLVGEQGRLLETLRLISHTQGLADIVVDQDTERLREIVLPVAVNNNEEAIEILDEQGTSLLSLRRRPNGALEDYEATRGETMFSQWKFVKDTLQQSDEKRDKFVGLARAPWGDFIYVSGPIRDAQGQRVGVILVGKSLSTIVNQIRQNTLAQTTIYDLDGQPIVSTLASFNDQSIILDQQTVSEVLERQEESALIRPLQLASINYSEIVGPWEIRESLGTIPATALNRNTGLIGVSLAETFLARPGQITRFQVFGLTAVSFLLVIALGSYLAHRITRPLLRVVSASAQVAQGNLDVAVDTQGNDEVAVLAHSFNEMVAGLREGNLYRDLLGRTVSPEVREQLREGFASGDVNLGGQEAIATVLMSDIRGFTTMSESEPPTTIMSWLNEYFEELVPIITEYGGVVSKFDGDAVLAFFGVLPRPLPAQDSAYLACQAALAMLDAVQALNDRRIKRGEPPLRAGIGINTGPVTAGALGSADRLHYTIIGDTVNSTQRLESLTRQLGEDDSAVISQHTLFALRERRHEFELEAMGAHNVKGKQEQLLVYHLKRAKVAVGG